MSCSEESLYSVQCILMLYNDSSKQWMTCGNNPFVSHVYILHNAEADSYRFVGISEQDSEVCILTCCIISSISDLTVIP